MGTIRKITLGEVFDAIEKNGYPQVKMYFGNEDGACAVGQGALNLNIDPSVLADGLRKFKVGNQSLPSAIYARNDGNGWTCSTIAKHFRNKLQESLDERVIEVVEE